MATEILYNDKTYSIITKEDNFTLCGDPEVGDGCEFLDFIYGEETKNDYSITPFCELFKKQLMDGGDDVDEYYICRLNKCVQCEIDRLNLFLKRPIEEEE
jgi:hypothetical protein